MSDFLSLSPDYAAIGDGGGNSASPDISLTPSYPSAHISSPDLSLTPVTTVYGTQNSGVFNGSSSVLTAKSSSGSGDVFSGLNAGLNEVGTVAKSASSIYSLFNPSKPRETLSASANPANLSSSAQNSAPAKEWIKGVPNSVLIIGAVGLLVVVGVIALK